jgi:hypothetical protein
MVGRWLRLYSGSAQALLTLGSGKLRLPWAHSGSAQACLGLLRLAQALLRHAHPRLRYAHPQLRYAHPQLRLKQQLLTSAD